MAGNYKVGAKQEERIEGSWPAKGYHHQSVYTAPATLFQKDSKQLTKMYI